MPRTTTPGPTPRLRVMPGADQFTQTGPRRFQLAFRWDVREAIPAGYMPFVHVTGPGGSEGESIVFQFGSGLSTPPDKWPVGQTTQGDPVAVTLPEILKDGTYAIKVGLYQEGGRLRLTGEDDGSRRFTVGTLSVADNGQTLRWQPADGVKATRLSAEFTEHTKPHAQISSIR